MRHMDGPPYLVAWMKGGLPSRLREYTGWYPREYVRAHLLRRRSSTRGWGGGLPPPPPPIGLGVRGAGPKKWRGGGGRDPAFRMMPPLGQEGKGGGGLGLGSHHRRCPTACVTVPHRCDRVPTSGCPVVSRPPRLLTIPKPPPRHWWGGDTRGGDRAWHDHHGMHAFCFTKTTCISNHRLNHCTAESIQSPPKRCKNNSTICMEDNDSLGAFSHSAGTAPIITVIIQVTALKTTDLRNHAQSIQNSKIQTSDACHGL